MWAELQLSELCEELSMLCLQDLQVLFNGPRAIVLLMRGFEVASGFPKTIGAIDGTHIRINAPKKNPTDYINRKGYHSIQLQVGNCLIYIYDDVRA